MLFNILIPFTPKLWVSGEGSCMLISIRELGDPIKMNPEGPGCNMTKELAPLLLLLLELANYKD
jgi:hypothetical protein